MALLINTDGTITEVFPADGKKFTLSEMQRHVGGYIEHIPYRFVKGALPKDKRGKNPAQAWVNENGKIDGMQGNRKATSVLNALGDFIAGPMLVTYAGEA